VNSFSPDSAAGSLSAPASVVNASGGAGLTPGAPSCASAEACTSSEALSDNSGFSASAAGHSLSPPTEECNEFSRLPSCVDGSSARNWAPP